MGQISVAHNFGMLCIRNLGTDFNLQTFQNMFDLQTLKLVELCARLSEVAQSCPTLCDLMDCSLSGPSVHGIFQARVLEWTAIFFSRGSSRPRNWTRVSCIAGRRFTVWATKSTFLVKFFFGGKKKKLV